MNHGIKRSLSRASTGGRRQSELPWISHEARMASRWPSACASRAPRIATSLFTFTVRDRETGDVLPGAVFTLSAPDNAAASCASDGAGVLRFSVWPGIRYHLREKRPPEGYQPDGTGYEVVIGFNGRLYVNGPITDNFTVTNVRLPGFGSFTAIRLDSLTGEPVAGAAYALCYAGQEVAAAVSSEAGEVAFCGLAPGGYHLLERSPNSCDRPCEPLAVTVAPNGAVCICGMPADGYLLPGHPVMGPQSPPDR